MKPQLMVKNTTIKNLSAAISMRKRFPIEKILNIRDYLVSLFTISSKTKILLICREVFCQCLAQLVALHFAVLI
jgi:hypothetical protein